MKRAHEELLVGAGFVEILSTVRIYRAKLKQSV